jgi:hypothetical protein
MVLNILFSLSVMPPLPAHFFCELVDDFCGGLLNLANGLIGLAFSAQFVVTGQRARGFFDSAFCDICFSTHDDAPLICPDNRRRPVRFRTSR